MTIYVNQLVGGSIRFSHAGIIVYPDKVYETDSFHNGGVLIEYGDYDKDNSKDSGYFYWYESNTGLRYISTSDVQRIYGEFIRCDVEYKMTVRDMLNEICSNGRIWNKSHYNFMFHDCQHFVTWAIYFLKATRHYNFQKGLSYSDDNVPPIIDEELRRNE